MAEEPTPVTGTVFIESDALTTEPTDDDLAKGAFIDDNKLTKAQQETVVMTGKQHVVGVGVTYTFTAEGK